MKVCYDLHIHSALSPCADNDMTPVNVVAAASAAGIELMAVADHNSIKNVAAAMEIGGVLGVTVVPAMELQSAEDIHFLCLFDRFENLEKFYNSIKFTDRENRPELYGEQLIIDSGDETTGEEKTMLSAGADIAETEVLPLAERFNGTAVPAHIDRDANGIIAILGEVPPYYKAVELSADCPPEKAAEFTADFKVIFDSDSHCLANIGVNKRIIDIAENSANALLSYLKGV